MASNPIYGICWLILLFFLSWPVAFFCSALWILFMVREKFIFLFIVIYSACMLNFPPWFNPYLDTTYSLLKHVLTVAETLTSRWKILLPGRKKLEKPLKNVARRALPRRLCTLNEGMNVVVTWGVWARHGYDKGYVYSKKPCEQAEKWKFGNIINIHSGCIVFKIQKHGGQNEVNRSRSKFKFNSTPKGSIYRPRLILSWECAFPFL